MNSKARNDLRYDRGGSNRRTVLRLLQHEGDLCLRQIRRLHGTLLVPGTGILSEKFQFKLA